MKVHAEIEYTRDDDICVHSDICPPNCDSDNLNDPKWRKFIHDCLDEYLDKSGGTGMFYLAQHGYLKKAVIFTEGYFSEEDNDI